MLILAFGEFKVQVNNMLNTIDFLRIFSFIIILNVILINLDSCEFRFVIKYQSLNIFILPTIHYKQPFGPSGVRALPLGVAA